MLTKSIFSPVPSAAVSCCDSHCGESGIVLDVGPGIGVSCAGLGDGERLALLLGELDDIVEAEAMAAAAVEVVLGGRRRGPVVETVDRVCHPLCEGVFAAGRPVMIGGRRTAVGIRIHVRVDVGTDRVDVVVPGIQGRGR